MTAWAQTRARNMRAADTCSGRQLPHTFASCFLLLQAHAARTRPCLIITIIRIILLLLLVLLPYPVLYKQQPIVFIAVSCCVSLQRHHSTA